MSITDKPWLTSYDPKVPRSINYRIEPVTAILDRAAEEFPGKPAIRFKNYQINYSRLKSQAGRFAAGLARLGVAPGDRVGIMLPNLPQTIISYWGALKAGATVVMINPLYMETELSHIIRDSGLKTLIILDLLWAKQEKFLRSLPISTFLVTRIGQALGFPLNWLYALKAWRQGQSPTLPRRDTRVRPWGETLRGPRELHHAPEDPKTALAMLQYTGGTTGLPKGVMLSHYNLGVNVQQAHAILHAIGRMPETFLGLLPFFHIYGLTVGINFATDCRATIVPMPRFDPLETVKAIDHYKPTVFPGTPSVYQALLQLKNLANYDLKSLRFFISGSAPLPQATTQRFSELTSAEIVEGYGLSEASPVTHLNPLVGTRKTGSIGLPFPDTTARVVDLADGKTPLRPGLPGELVIKGPQVMSGYWNQPQETALALKDGWLHTGDVAVMDEQGYFFIVDRLKDLIISGGYNIYPREIEEVLMSHPKVAEAAAVGVPHPSRGEVVKAFVVPKPDQSLTRQEIMAFCKERLAAYKAPKVVEFRERLPKTFVGKVLRRALRQEDSQPPV